MTAKVRTTLLGFSTAMKSVVDTLTKVASRPVIVSLEGETGTGKELAARLLHNLSERKERPFVAINCAAIPETLIESELFGHEKGAFTNAFRQHKGAFEQADKGTLLLDEVTEIPLHLQAKLLRVLQEGEIRRVGGKETIPVDVRVVAATNKGLLKALKEGKFRQDLFYRLDVVRIRMPSLREHPEDIPLLVEHFVVKVGAELGITPLPKVSSDATNTMFLHTWPGNVRELERCITRALALHSGEEISPEDLGINHLGKFENGAAVTYPKTFRVVQQDAVLRALEAFGGNRTRAAKALGVNVVTVRRYLREYIDRTPTEAQGLPVGRDFLDSLKRGEEKSAAIVEPPVGSVGSEVDLGLDNARKRLLWLTLQRTKMNMRAAASLMGVSPKTVYNWCEKYGWREDKHWTVPTNV